MAEQTIKEPRDFPAIEELLQHPALAEALTQLPRPIIVDLARETVARYKEQLQKDRAEIPLSQLLAALRKAIETKSRRKLTRVINATGILVHTNLGRAPLPSTALEKIVPIITGYTNVEFDLESGERGVRGILCEEYLARLADAEAATVTNNCAAALFVVVNSLANRKSVVVSRGELVQIGGGFRIPDILKRAGAKLTEVGTTNITTLKDYETALDDRTGFILKVHKSNFVQSGFTDEVPLKELVALGKKHNLPVVNDLGSGVLVDTASRLGYAEPTVQQSVRAGADLTCFSGDKLLGGPQAGLIVGRSDLVRAVKKNPLFRTVRVDKLVFALLEHVLAAYLDGQEGEIVPVWSMLAVPASELYKSGKQILAAIGAPPGVSVEATKAYIGGGALPESDIPSVALVFAPNFEAEKLFKAFRRQPLPVIGRIENDRFLLDLKAIAPADYDYLVRSIKQIIAGA